MVVCKPLYFSVNRVAAAFGVLFVLPLLYRIYDSTRVKVDISAAPILENVTVRVCKQNHHLKGVRGLDTFTWRKRGIADVPLVSACFVFMLIKLSSYFYFLLVHLPRWYRLAWRRVAHQRKKASGKKTYHPLKKGKVGSRFLMKWQNGA